MANGFDTAQQGLGLASGVAAATGVGLPISLGIAGLQGLLGGFQYLNAIKQAKKNQRPTYTIDPTFQQNIDTLTNTMGLPQSALDLYYRQIGQNTNQGINAINGLGGNANDIASLIGNRNASYENIAVQDSLQKKQDIGGIIAARLQLADQKDKAFQINKYAPYADKAQAIASEKASGVQNIFGAFGSAAGAFANNATGKLADSLSNPMGAGKKLVDGTVNTQLYGNLDNITTSNSGVNVNAIIAALQSHASQQPQFQQPQLGQYNQYLTPQPQNNFDYQAWFNNIFGAQGLNISLPVAIIDRTDTDLSAD